VLETGRISIAAMAVGVAQACLDESLKYAKARLQFGQPIFNFQAVQIHGGYGYMEEYPVSRYYKSVKLLQIVEGTSEVQRMLIARILAGSSHH
jgi:alkylation response protein AidB-like acyl-CoA dehydrogenase